MVKINIISCSNAIKSSGNSGSKYRYCLALTLLISFVLQIARIFLFIFFFIHMWTHFDEASVFSVIPHQT